MEITASIKAQKTKDIPVRIPYIGGIYEEASNYRKFIGIFPGTEEKKIEIIKISYWGKRELEFTKTQYTISSGNSIPIYDVDEGMKSPDPYHLPDDPTELNINKIEWILIDENSNEVTVDITDLYNDFFSSKQTSYIEELIWEDYINSK
jgi:hypothetical protein